MNLSENAQPPFHSGFVALIGAPNAGKSTLMNRMLKEKISITSKKPQTTRNRILGVLHRPNCQMVFMDTPGVHPSEKPLNVQMVQTALGAVSEADLLVVLIDCERSRIEAEKLLVQQLSKTAKPALLALNKIDLVDKQDLLALMDRWQKQASFKALLPISAKTGEGVEALLDEMEPRLPEGPPYFPPDALTDVPERFLAAEMIRERVFRTTGEEIPYAVAVVVESFKEKKDGSLITIHATIHVERDSQKAIIIGKGGHKIKQIGIESRQHIERMLATQVNLKLFVRVQKNWTRDTRAIRRFGY